MLETRIMQSVIYPTSAASGTTVLDAEPNNDASKEINALALELISKFK